MSERILMKNVTKKYGDFYANNEITFSLQDAEIHAIIGENGAGKTTLMRILYGLEEQTSGSLYVNGKPVRFSSPTEAIKRGIGMVHQHFMLFPHLTVAENIVIGHEPSSAGLFNRKKAVSQVKELAASYKMTIDPTKKVKHCSVGEQQRIEILKVLYQGAETIILDEPTAVLTPHEVKGLMDTLKLLATSGKSIIIITHKLKEVMACANRITVLRNGEVTGSRHVDETSEDELATLMVGRDLKEVPPRAAQNGATHLEVKNVVVGEKGEKPTLHHVSLQVKQGEIVGIAGVSGNGQSELIQAITGLIPIESGDVTMDGESVNELTVYERRQKGISHIPEDRYQWGIAKSASVAENALMGYQYIDAYQSVRGVINRRRFRPLVTKWIEQFAIKTNSLQQQIDQLSGGNIQKLVVARELGHESSFLIAAEPTRGVDIGAMERIHEALIERRNEGASILLVSSELSEIRTLSDRIVVMFEGKIVGELSRDEATEEKISILMAGGTVHA